MKTLVKIKSYFKSIWMAVIGGHWYERTWLKYDKEWLAKFEKRQKVCYKSAKNID
jgi:hypothetical protein